MASPQEKLRALQEIADAGRQGELPDNYKAAFLALVEAGDIVLPQGQTRAAPNPRAARSHRLRQESDRFDSLLKQIDAGEISGADLTPVESREVQRRRIDAIPEITGSFPQLSENLGFLDAMAGMTAFDPAEFGQILTNADPDIGVVMTPEGEHIAVNNKTGATFSINKRGPSMMDAVQVGGAALAFTPAGKLPGLTRQAIGAGLTQSVIETGQALKGGQFDPEAVAMTAVGVPVASKALSGAQLGINGLRKTFNISTPQTPKVKVTPWFGQESKNTAKIREALVSGEGDKVAAGYMLDGSRKVVSDPAARELIKQGKGLDSFDPGKVSLFSGASKLDKKAFSEMVEIVSDGLTNAKKAALHRPGSVVGDSLMQRYKFVQAVNRQAGKDVGKAAKALKGSDVDTTTPMAGFLDDLEGQGVSIVDGELDFALSAFEDIPGAEKLLKDLWKRLNVLDKSRDGLHIHRFKKFIDNQVDIGKRGNNPIVADAERIALNLRGSVNKSLQDVSPAYANANQRFSESIGPLKEFQRISGKNFDPESVNANEFAGKIARRMLSNVQSREPLIDAIHAMDEIAINNGAKFNTDIATQIMFVEQLEQSFGSFAQTGISSEVGKGVSKAMRGDKIGIIADAAGHVINKARRVNEEAAIKALKEFVKTK